MQAGLEVSAEASTKQVVGIFKVNVEQVLRVGGVYIVVSQNWGDRNIDHRPRYYCGGRKVRRIVSFWFQSSLLAKSATVDHHG